MVESAPLYPGASAHPPRPQLRTRAPRLLTKTALVVPGRCPSSCLSQPVWSQYFGGTRLFSALRKNRKYFFGPCTRTAHLRLIRPFTGRALSNAKGFGWSEGFGVYRVSSGLQSVGCRGPAYSSGWGEHGLRISRRCLGRAEGAAWAHLALETVILLDCFGERERFPKHRARLRRGTLKRDVRVRPALDCRAFHPQSKARVPPSSPHRPTIAPPLHWSATFRSLST